jgi:drug/metabolite transporter (DMT)-like permease
MNIGLIYVLIAEFFWAGELVLIRRFFPDINPIFLASAGSILGSLFYLPTFFIFKQKIPSGSWLILILYALISWFCAQIFFVTGVQKGLNAFTISLATLSLPFFAFILSTIFLKEPINIKMIVGGIIMTAGFLIIST